MTAVGTVVGGMLRIKPVAASRVRVPGRGTYYREPYKSFREIAPVLIREAVGYAKVQGPVRLSVAFGMPMAKSWSKRKRAERDGTFHTQTPDMDNLVKALKDAITKAGLWPDDKVVAAYGHCKKVWSIKGWIRFRVEEI